MKLAEIETCPDCGDTHLGRCGGLSYRQRLLSIRLDISLIESRTKQNYYDEEAVTNLFGKNRQERIEEMNEDTKGRGPLTREQMEKTDSETLDWYCGSDREEDGDAPF